jgi:hypothetical protein
MTELRDARLRQALDQAPDAGLQPPARVRDAIRAAAHGAVQPAWRRWWLRVGEWSPSWTAAFASVAVATLVVVIWQGQDVPGAREEPRLADHPAAAPVVAPASAPAAVPAPAPATATAPAPAPQRAAPAPERRAPVRREQPKPEAAARAAADALADRQRESSERRVQEQAGTEAAVRQELAKAAPPPLPPAAIAPAPAPAPAMVPPPPPASVAAAAPTLTTRFAAPAAPAWNQVRISSGERSVLVPRSQAEGLPALINRLLAAPREPAPLALGTLRLELEAQGVLEWSEQGWRLLPQGDPQRAQLLKADEATAAALRAEAERLLNR